MSTDTGRLIVEGQRQPRPPAMPPLNFRALLETFIPIGEAEELYGDAYADTEPMGLS